MDEINTLLVISVNCRTINNVEIFGQWLMPSLAVIVPIIILIGVMTSK